MIEGADNAAMMARGRVADTLATRARTGPPIFLNRSGVDYGLEARSEPIPFRPTWVSGMFTTLLPWQAGDQRNLYMGYKLG